MVRWITENLGTAKRIDVDDKEGSVVDVRDLVDKAGNTDQVVLERINTVVDLLKQKHKVIVCCDYGMSRSNAIAVGAIAKYSDYGFDEATKSVMERTGEAAINIDILNSVRRVLEINSKDSVSNSSNTLLITGGTGFIGSSLAAKLAENHNVVMPTRQEVDLLDGPVRLDLVVKSNGVDTVLHLANPRVYSTNEAMGKSVIMLKNVLDVCRENNTKLVYVSNWEVYSGYRSESLLASEALPKFPKGAYGSSKYLCESLVEQHHRLYGLEYAILRCSSIYGIGSDRPKFIYSFLNKALSDEDITTHKYRNGFPILDLLYIDDLISVFLDILQSNYCGFLNIGSGIGVSTSELAGKIVEITASKSVIKHHDIQDFAPNIVMDISKAKAILGWYPKTNIGDGLTYLVNNLNLEQEVRYK